MSFKLHKLVSSSDYVRTLRQFDLNIKKNGLILKAKITKCSKARIGYNIPKKGTRLAHKRNRLKRLIKEYFRLNASNLPKMDYVLILKEEIPDNLLIDLLTKIFFEVNEAYISRAEQQQSRIRWSFCI